MWHFRVWHGHVEGTYVQLVFFWNDAKSESGVVEFRGDQALHVSRLKQVIAKLVSSSEYRLRFRRDLEFPVEAKYATYRPLG